MYHIESLMNHTKPVRRIAVLGVPSTGLVPKVCAAPRLMVILAASA